jgi:hypothetical protein
MYPYKYHTRESFPLQEILLRLKKRLTMNIHNFLKLTYLFPFTVAHVLIQNYESDEDIFEKCVDKMLTLHYHPGSLIYAVDTALKTSFPVVRQNSLKVSLQQFKHELPNTYVINLQMKNITEMLEFLQDFEIFNSRARFIILSGSHPQEEIFTVLPKYFIYNAVVVDNEGNLFTYEPFIFEDVTAAGVPPTFLGNCKTFTFKKTILDVKIPKLWRNTTVPSLIASFSTGKHLKDQRPVNVEREICRIVEEKFKFGYEIKLTYPKTYGHQNEILGLFAKCFLN